MPTILRIGSYKFFFYAGDHGEPPHIHVEHDDNIAKLKTGYKSWWKNISKLRGWNELFSDYSNPILIFYCNFLHIRRIPFSDICLCASVCVCGKKTKADHYKT